MSSAPPKAVWGGGTTPQVATLLLGLALTGALLAVGAVHPQVTAMVALGCAIAWLVTERQGRFCSALFRDGGFQVLAFLIAFAGLRLLPLPLSWVAAVASPLSDTWEATASVRNSDWGYLTLDVQATRFEALKLLLYLGGYCTAWMVRRTYGTRAILWLIVIAVFALALSALVHRAFSLRRVFGVYRPLSHTLGAVAPLINPNNLAGVCNAGVVCGLTLLWHPKTATELRWPLVAAALLLSTTSVLTGSRAGLASLLLGLFGAMFLYDKRRVTNPRTLAAFAAGGLGLLALIWAGGDEYFARSLAQSSNEKLDLFGWAIAVVLDSPWLGVGPGAAESELLQYQSGSTNRYFSAAESFPIDWALSWGLPVAVGLVVLVLRRLRLRGRRSRLSNRGLRLALVALLLQNLFDLGLEVPAVALVVVVGLAGLAPTDQRVRPLPGWLLKSRLVPPVAALVGALLFALSPPRTARAERHSVSAMLPQPDTAERLALAAALRHPADPFLLRMAAVESHHHGRRDALRWVNLSLRRDPKSGATLVTLAQILAARGASEQALLSLKRAASLDPDLASTVVSLARKLEPADIGTIVPERRGAIEVLQQLSMQEKDLDRRLSWLERLVFMGDGSAQVRLARELLSQRTRRASRCAGPQDPCLARAYQLHDTLPDSVPSHRRRRLRAALYTAVGEHSAALSVLQQTCTTKLGRSCHLQKFSAALETELPEQAARAAKQYVAAACVEVPQQCVAVTRNVARRLLRAGHSMLALGYFRDAARRAGTASAWIELAEVAVGVGRLQEGMRALTKARPRADSAAERTRISELQSLILKRAP